MIHKANFFAVLRAGLFGGKLSGKQVFGMEAVLDYYAAKYSDLESLAYILATAYHESAGTFAGIEEYGKGTKHVYGGKVDIDRKPYSTPNQLYYGRGLVQITWRANYLRIGKLLDVDLLNHPEKALQLDVAVKILVEGMANGWFTGKKLADYFAGPKADAVGARKIVNGTDKAQLIAGYYDHFLDALTI